MNLIKPLKSRQNYPRNNNRRIWSGCRAKMVRNYHFCSHVSMQNLAYYSQNCVYNLVTALNHMRPILETWITLLWQINSRNFDIIKYVQKVLLTNICTRCYSPVYWFRFVPVRGQKQLKNRYPVQQLYTRGQVWLNLWAIRKESTYTECSEVTLWYCTSAARRCQDFSYEYFKISNSSSLTIFRNSPFCFLL